MSSDEDNQAVTLESLIRRALGEDDALGRIRDSLVARVEAGTSTEELQAHLAETLQVFIRNGENDAEDLTRDALDLVVGWCAPHLRINEQS